MARVPGTGNHDTLLGTRPQSISLNELGQWETNRSHRPAYPEVCSAFGEVSITQNTAPIPMTAAVDPTLADNGDYVLLQGVWNGIPVGNNHLVEQSDGILVIKRPGIYRIELWSSLSADVNNAVISFRHAQDGVIQLGRRPRVKIGVAHDIATVSAHGFVKLARDEEVQLWLACDRTCNVLIEDLVFSVQELLTGEEA